MRLLTKTILAMSVAAVVAGCGDQVGPELEKLPSTYVAKFNPNEGADGIPFPIDLMFGAADGSLDIPGADANPAFAAMNTLNGFSTTAPLVVRFSGPVDNPANPDDVKNGILLFSTDAPSPAGPVETIVESKVFGVDYAAGINGGVSGMIFPLKPLAPSTTHLVVVTSDLETRYGQPVGADDVYALGKGAFSLQASSALGSAVANFAVAADGTSVCDFSDQGSLPTCQLNPAYLGLAASNEVARQIVGGVKPLFDTAQKALAENNLAGFSKAMISIGMLDTLRGQIAEDLTALASASVDVTKVVLSYRVTTQDIGTAQTKAKEQVDASSPALSVLNPVSGWSPVIPGTSDPNPLFDVRYPVVSPGDDGVPNDVGDHSAHIYLATLDDIVQFVDPDDPNNSVWGAAGPTGNLSAFNGFDPVAASTSYSVPVLISAPRIESLNPALDPGDNFADCTGSLPVVIFQHGITSNRGSLMALADTLAKACTVGVAIDLPKHGISPADSTFAALGGLHAILSGGAVLERLVKVGSTAECQAGAGAPVGDGDFYCPSGDNFVNLVNLANSRDTLRQAAVDLHSLYRALVDDAGAELNAGTIGTTIDANNIHFVGMSLGGIVGGVFAAKEPDLATVTLNVAGGGIAKILDGSPTFEPVITEGLYESTKNTAAPVVKPGGGYEGFMIMAQTLVDSADPINYTADLSAHKLLMQVVLNDEVVPNNTFGTSFGGAWGFVAQTDQQNFLQGQNFLTVPVALSGSDALAQGTGFVVSGSVADQNPAFADNVLGAGVLGGDNIIAAVNGMIPNTFPAGTTTFKGLGLPGITGECAALKGVVRFTKGTHSSLLRPQWDPESTLPPTLEELSVTATMQGQIASFVKEGSVLDTETVLDSAGLPEALAVGLIHKGVTPSQSNVPCL